VNLVPGAESEQLPEALKQKAQRVSKSLSHLNQMPLERDSGTNLISRGTNHDKKHGLN